MRAIVFGCIALLITAAAAWAQQAPLEPGFVAAKARFESLDMAARRDIQRDLIWVAGYSGAASGEFGALTFAAIKRFQALHKAGNAATEGVLDATGRAALATAAQAARSEAGFRIETDKASGIRIGVPSRLLSKRSKNAAGLDRWQDSAGRVTLDLQAAKPEDSLSAIFAKGTEAKANGRKITYKLLRPDFFVISGQTATGLFYRRFEKGQDGRLHGFSIGYDKHIAAEFEPMVFAIAASFLPFPPPDEAARGDIAAPPPAPSPPTALSSSAPSPARRQRITAILVAEGQLVTAQSAVMACRNLALAAPERGALRLLKAEGGLALLGAAAAMPAALLATNRILPLARSLPARGLLLQRDLDGKLIATSAEINGSLALAPLQEGGAGAPIFDSAGAIAALVISEPIARYAVAGTIPVLSQKLADAAQIAAFAGIEPGKPPNVVTPDAATPGAVPPGAVPRSPGEIAASAEASIVSLLCD